MGLLRRPTPGEIVEDGPAGAHSRASQKNQRAAAPPCPNWLRRLAAVRACDHAPFHHRDRASAACWASWRRVPGAWLDAQVVQGHGQVGQRTPGWRRAWACLAPGGQRWAPRTLDNPGGRRFHGKPGMQDRQDQPGVAAGGSVGEARSAGAWDQAGAAVRGTTWHRATSRAHPDQRAAGGGGGWRRPRRWRWWPRRPSWPGQPRRWPSRPPRRWRSPLPPMTSGG